VSRNTTEEEEELDCMGSPERRALKVFHPFKIGYDAPLRPGNLLIF